MLRSRPLVSAHRHGNDLASLRAAEAVGVDLVEIDVHLFWGRLEARHGKSVGPLPLFFDRGQRIRWNPPRERFDDLVAAARPDTVFHVDLKGWSPRLSRRVMATLEQRHQYLVSARSWWLLRPFRRLDNVQVMRSIGATWQLQWFLRWHRQGTTDAVCIRSDRLTPRVTRELSHRSTAVLTWRIASVAHADELIAWGVDGVIVDELDLARSLVERQRSSKIAARVSEH